MYAEATSQHGAAIRRLARGYEADHDKRKDLLQEIHLELWTSLKTFDARCSLKTWVYRIAHNVGASHVMRSRRLASRLVDLETVDAATVPPDPGQNDQRLSMASLLELIHRLKPLDREIILLYLEGEPAESIAEVTGISAVNVATRIHRIKKVLRQKYQGAADARS